MPAKILSILLILTLLCGCAAPATQPAPTAQPTMTPTAAPQEEATPTPEPTATPAPAYPVVDIDAPEGSPVKEHGLLHVEGTHLVDMYGNIVQLKGVSTHGLAWFPDYVNPDAFAQLKDWGVQIVRLALYTDENMGYCLGDEAYQQERKAQLLAGVKYATELGLYVLIDWHILRDGDPNIYKDQALAFFGEISAALAEQPNVLYEICNEPNGIGWRQITDYAKEVIPVIRANQPYAPIIVGTSAWSSAVDWAANAPITEYDNLMYTFHFYAAEHRDDRRKLLEDAVKKGLPVFVTEYGLTAANGKNAINEEQGALWMELLDRYQIGSIIWNLSNADEECALIRHDCTKLSGWTDDDLTDQGRWFRDMLSK